MSIGDKIGLNRTGLFLNDPQPVYPSADGQIDPNLFYSMGIVKKKMLSVAELHREMAQKMLPLRSIIVPQWADRRQNNVSLTSRTDLRDRPLRSASWRIGQFLNRDEYAVSLPCFATVADSREEEL